MSVASLLPSQASSDTPRLHAVCQPAIHRAMQAQVAARPIVDCRDGDMLRSGTRKTGADV